MRVSVEFLYVHFVPGCTVSIGQRTVNGRTKCHTGMLVRHLETEHLGFSQGQLLR